MQAQKHAQTKLDTSSNIGRDKSFVDDLNKELGIVRMRVAFVPRSAEIQPTFWRFVTFTLLTKFQTHSTIERMISSLISLILIIVSAVFCVELLHSFKSFYDSFHKNYLIRFITRGEIRLLVFCLPHTLEIL